MALLRFDQVSLAYGLKPLLANVDFVLEEKERVCLVGRNGEGKSSFLKILTEDVIPDSGDYWLRSGVGIAYLQQEIPDLGEKTVFDAVAGGLAETGELLAEFHHLTQQPVTEQQMSRMESVQHKLEALDGWSLNNRVDAILDRLNLPSETPVSQMSGGWKRRVLLARALVSNPDVLVLDEPTNHLDIPTIKWLEEQLAQFPGAIVFVSHDRAFIKSMASRIIELDRGRLSSWPGDYDAYLTAKQKWLEDEARQNALFDKKLSEEEAWIRKGIKARRTRNEGRVRALQALRQQRKERIDVVGNVNLNLEGSESSGKIVVEAKNLTWRYDQQTPLVENFSVRILRGDRIGLVGENGCGKTTLINLLLGRLNPEQGKVKRGTNLQIAYFDQLRATLDETVSVADNVAEGRDFIEINGKQQHIIGYLNNFLFTGERARTPVSALSGGERNRLLLAKLFSKPANLLVMDEPTNDLDVETLELLEDALSDFQGTLLITSHDREFLDNVVTSTLVFEGGGKIREYVGGYEDWRRQGGEFPCECRQQRAPEKVEKKNGVAADGMPKQKSKAGQQRKKLSFKQKHELESLPAAIEVLEAELERLQAEISAPEFYSGDHEAVNATLSEVSRLERELELKMERWVELESLLE